MCFEVTSDVEVDRFCLDGFWIDRFWLDEEIYCNDCFFKKEYVDSFENKES